MSNKITQERLKELLNYDADTGIFAWHVARNGYKGGQTGVSWDAVRKQWFAKITSNRQQFPLGRFALLSDAIAAYVTAKAKIHTFHPGAVSP